MKKLASELEKRRIRASEGMRVFRERMYRMGYKQKCIWVKSGKSPSQGREALDRTGFTRRLISITAELSATELSALFKELLKAAEAKTSAKKRR